MIGDGLSFERPELLLLLLLVPFVGGLQIVALLRRRRALAVFGGRGAGLSSVRDATLWMKVILMTVAAASLAVALAGPRLGFVERAVRPRGVDLVVLLDVSQSMAVRDIAPDRLRAARDFIEALGAQLVGSRVALVLFGGDAVVRYPATDDPKVLTEVLDNSSRGLRPAGGSSLQAGIEASATAFPPTADARRARAVVVISDGEITAGGAPRADALRDQGIRVYAIGVGSPTGGPIPTYTQDGKFAGMLLDDDGRTVISRLNEETLRAIVRDGGGRYWRLGSGAPLRDLVTDLRALDTSEVLGETLNVPEDRTQVALGIAVAALLLEWLLGDRRAMPRPRALRTPIRGPSLRRVGPTAPRTA